MRRTATRVLGLAALATVYFAAAKLGLRLAFVQENATAVWPPSGIALAALLLAAPGAWPGVFVGALLANLTIAGSLTSSLAIATGNTLEALQGAVQLVLRQGRRSAGVDPVLLRRALEIAERESQKFGRLVTQLLETSRIDGGPFMLNCGTEDLSAIVRRAVERAQPSTEEHSFVVDAPPRCTGYMDGLRIEQVITNLFDNAMKYSPQGGAIEVTVTQPRPDMIFLTVRDHGIGIPVADLSHIFDRLHRAHADSDRCGLGLGLYVSRRIVEAHGGGIRVDLPADGGSRFEIGLPVTTAGSQHESVDGGTR